jgi:small-conductance mechanosensitive channel
LVSLSRIRSPISSLDSLSTLNGLFGPAIGSRLAAVPEGEIIEGNWRATWLRTRAGDLVVVPNGVLAKSVVTKRYWPSRVHAANAIVTFGHDVDPEHATHVLLEAAQDQSLDLADPTPSVSMLSWGPLGISYSLDFYVADYADAPGIMNKVLRAIWRAAKKKGLPFAPSLPSGNTFSEECRACPMAANIPTAGVK